MGLFRAQDQSVVFSLVLRIMYVAKQPVWWTRHRCSCICAACTMSMDFISPGTCTTVTLHKTQIITFVARIWQLEEGIKTIGVVVTVGMYWYGVVTDTMDGNILSDVMIITIMVLDVELGTLVLMGKQAMAINLCHKDDLGVKFVVLENILGGILVIHGMVSL
jgi:hypothetical protein